MWPGCRHTVSLGKSVPQGPAARVPSPLHETQKAATSQSCHQTDMASLATELRFKEGDGNCSHAQGRPTEDCVAVVLPKKQGINLDLDLNLLVTSIHFTSSVGKTKNR